MILHQNENNHGMNDGPVTVIVTRKAKKDKIGEFEEWMDGIIHEAMKFEGHMGVNIIRPSDPTNPEYVVIFRFNTYENLSKWEKSETRREWLNKSRTISEGEPTVEMQSGLEFWFTPRSGVGDIEVDRVSAAPPRYKMVMVIVPVIFALVSLLLPQVRQLTAGLPVFFSTLVGVGIMVLLMTYLIMPPVTRALRPWLKRKRLF